jgi:hypothetical protein
VELELHEYFVDNNFTHSHVWIDPAICHHSWATYNSGWVSFQYCTKCNANQTAKIGVAV